MLAKRFSRSLTKPYYNDLFFWIVMPISVHDALNILYTKIHKQFRNFGSISEKSPTVYSFPKMEKNLHLWIQNTIM